MNDFTTLERELISKARGALEPAATDQSRLRSQLAARLAGVSLAAPAAPAHALPAHPLRHLWQSHLAALGAVATSAALIAFGAGYAAGKHARAPVVKSFIVQASSPKLEAANTPAVVDPESDESSLASLSDLRHSGTRPRVAASMAAGGAGAASAESQQNPLAEELDLLGRAERMIRGNNPMVAIGLLSEMDRKFPKGQLLEERSAARAMANCQLVDEDSARLQGQAYLSTHAQSVYAERVRAICHLDSATSAKDSPAPGD